MGTADAGRTRQLLIQIDGLSRPALERAIAGGSAPELARMIGEGSGHRLISLYTGLPSTTPAVQGEFFYGVARSVPAFAFIGEDGQPRHMLEPEAADGVQREIEGRHPALLEGGSAYCNVYTGGARVSRFCAAGLARPVRVSARGLKHQLRTLVMYAGVGVRSLVMLAGEVVRLVVERRFKGGPSLVRRIRDSWYRVLLSVVMRDSSRLQAIQDMRDGLPVVHINFLGYDKQAHRFGPDSAPAMRALKGIDKAIGSLVRSLGEASGEDATVVVYSDHGQESTTPIHRVAGAEVSEVVRDALREVAPETNEPAGGERRAGGRTVAASVAERLGEKMLGVSSSREEDEPGRSVTTVEAGPIANVYFEGVDDTRVLGEIAARIARRVEGIAVLTRDEDGRAVGYCGRAGPLSMGELCERRLVEHPFADRIAPDLEGLVAHGSSGDLILLGAGFDERPLTFVHERGSHAGPGPVETHAFAIVAPRLGLEGEEPASAPRFEDLRAALLSERSDGADG